MNKETRMRRMSSIMLKGKKGIRKKARVTHHHFEAVDLIDRLKRREDVAPIQPHLFVNRQKKAVSFFPRIQSNTLFLSGSFASSGKSTVLFAAILCFRM